MFYDTQNRHNIIILCAAALTITQGRIINNHGHIEVDVYSVVGIATVELSGDPASRPTYYFDCKTTRNNASGLMWTKMNNQTRFEVQVIPDGSPGKRLNASGIGYHDLDKYVCSDTTSNDVASINITGRESTLSEIPQSKMSTMITRHHLDCVAISHFTYIFGGVGCRRCYETSIA